MNLHMKSIRLLSVMLCWFLTIPVDSLSIIVYYWHFSSLLVNFRQYSSLLVTSRHFSSLLITSRHFSPLLVSSCHFNSFWFSKLSNNKKYISMENFELLQESPLFKICFSLFWWAFKSTVWSMRSSTYLEIIEEKAFYHRFHFQDR